MWIIDTEDWKLEPGGGACPPPVDPACVAAYVQNEINTYSTTLKPLDIALHHDRVPTTLSDVVPFLIDWAQSKGHRLVTVGECLGDPPANWYRGVVTLPSRDSSWTC